jgi:hypothetical protein
MTKTAKTPANHWTAKTGSPPPPGTRVQLTDGAEHQGTVMPYTPGTSPALQGLFPVRLDNWIWQICCINDVTVLVPPPTQVDQ